MGLSLDGPCELSIVMPCLNEAETIRQCIAKARAFLERSGVAGEIIVADNGSDDSSQAMAAAAGARVVEVPERGYGSALIAGIRAARGAYVVMGDSDDSYDFSALDAFVEKLRAGYQLVMGNRFKGGIKPGAMPFLHRYLGNPVLTTIGRLFFGAPVGDFHCGLRAFRRDAILALDLQAPGMEFASEMVVKATLQGLRVTEVPTTLWPDGRSRPPHLRRWRDGWRHLRFLLLFSPNWLFLFPGFATFAVGVAGMAWLAPGPRSIAGIGLDIHTLFYCSLAVITGFNSMLFWLCAKLYGAREGFVPGAQWLLSAVEAVRLEYALLAGAGLFLFGLAASFYALSSWGAGRFGPLQPTETMRLVIPAGTAILLGLQTAYGAFFISFIAVRAGRGSTAAPRAASLRGKASAVGPLD
jgi:glycosyltransferase involved in cell wall biosynthesis